MNFESVQRIEAEVSCKDGLNPDKANGIIKEFREQLEALRLQNAYDHLQGRIIYLDDFSWNQPTPNLLICKWKTKWNVIDNGSGSTAERFNNQTRALVAKLIHTVTVHENGIQMKILDVSYR